MTAYYWALDNVVRSTVYKMDRLPIKVCIKHIPFSPVSNISGIAVLTTERENLPDMRSNSGN